MKAFNNAMAGIFLSLLCAVAGAEEPPVQSVTLDIDAPTMVKALIQFTQQSGLQLIFPTDEEAARIPARKLTGTYTPEVALDRLLKGSGLQYEFINPRTIAIRLQKSTTSLPADGREAQGEAVQLALARTGFVAEDALKDRAAPEAPERAEAVPEILVRGSKVLNMDIRRSADDAQPYVIFDRRQIEQSAAVNLEDFLRQRLMANTTVLSPSQSDSPVGLGSASSIDLRGLGSNQTLILIDGHRSASFAYGGSAQQPDINGIPLSAVERIEVLATTASGIYGGSATGGVINIILRRDYAGVETKVTYENTFDTDVSRRRVDVSGGFSLESGKTDVIFSASYSDGNVLLEQDRGFQARTLAHRFANNPAAVLNATTPLLGATTNIRSSNGSPLILKNGTALNSPITFVPAGYAGTADGGAALVANAGRYNLELANTAQTNGGRRASLVNNPTVKSFNAAIRRPLSGRVQAFLDLSASSNDGAFYTNRATRSFTIPVAAPNNPFGQAIRVTTPIFGGDGVIQSSNEKQRVVGGVIMQLAAGWRAEADYTWDQTRFSNASHGESTAQSTAAVTSGALDVLRDTNAFPVDFSPYIGQTIVTTDADTRLQNAVIRLAGPVWRLPAGAASVSTSIEHRRESLGNQRTIGGSYDAFFPSRSQRVNSVYLEVNLPLVAPHLNWRGVHELDLQLSGRRDEYETSGANNISATSPDQDVQRATNNTDSTNPTIGLRYRPVRDLMLRLSYGSGFLPPAVEQLVTAPPFDVEGFLSGLLGLRDPLRGNELLGDFFVLTGGNADLRPEESKSRSAGIVWTPDFVPGFRASIDWTEIQKMDNITSFSLGGATIVTFADFAPSRLPRGPVAPGDPYGVGPIIGLDLTLLNIAQTRLQMYDLALQYDWETSRFGAFGITAGATRQVQFETQIVPSAPLVENLGQRTHLKWKSFATLSWDYRAWRLAWSTRYYDGYWLNLAHNFDADQGSAMVRSQDYHDLYASYRFADAAGDLAAAPGLLSGLELQAGVKNVFNTLPPIDVRASGNALANAAQLASYYISIKKAF